MPRAKSNLSQQQVLLKRADASYEYRQMHRAEVNEKARLRMQRRRAELKRAPSAVQLEYVMRARKHRRDYREREKRVGQPKQDKSTSRVNTTTVPLRPRKRPTASSASSCTSAPSPTPPIFTFTLHAADSPRSSVDDESGDEEHYDGGDEEEYDDDDITGTAL
ncbi:hypothetical protein R3P38DRAFT_3195474 [Favolaschia claudopus]|uniref:Uncharacterized protein n=1 Tax=Favolaschia claudopus TaxID=2862362 RepID=A0AAW0B754_9AGAR